jgi:hypothetical protein
VPEIPFGAAEVAVPCYAPPQLAGIVADRPRTNGERGSLFRVSSGAHPCPKARASKGVEARDKQSIVARTPRTPWDHGASGPTCRTELAKRTGPNGRAVGPEIHAEARTNALGRSRTFNLQIKSLLLCQLSYECKKPKRRRVTCLVVRPKRLTPTARHPPAEPARRTSTSGAPGGTRTPDPQLRRLSLYPAELLAQRPNRRSVPPSATSRGARI